MARTSTTKEHTLTTQPFTPTEAEAFVSQFVAPEAPPANRDGWTFEPGEVAEFDLDDRDQWNTAYRRLFDARKGKRGDPRNRELHQAICEFLGSEKNRRKPKTGVVRQRIKQHADERNAKVVEAVLAMLVERATERGIDLTLLFQEDA